MPKIFHLSVIEMALVETAGELLNLQDLKHLFEVFCMFFWCLAVHKNIVQYTLPNLTGEALVHEHLEDSWSIHRTKR